MKTIRLLLKGNLLLNILLLAFIIIWTPVGQVGQGVVHGGVLNVVKTDSDAKKVREMATDAIQRLIRSEEGSKTMLQIVLLGLLVKGASSGLLLYLTKSQGK